MSPSPSRLPLKSVVGFALIGVPLAAIGLPVSVFLQPFYAGEMGLGLATTGAIFMLLRFWDLVTDPVMGYLVDRRPSRWGRVRHWLVLSIPVLSIATIFLYMPASETVSPLYLAGWMAVFFVGFTMLQTPHAAWAPALAHDYDERSRLFQWREIVNIASLLALLALPAILAQSFGFDRRQQVMVMGWILIIALPLTIGSALFLTPDPPMPGSAGAAPDYSPKAVRQAVRNSTLWRIVGMEICVGIAISSTAATYLFAAKWGFGVDQGASAILMLFFIAGFCALPFWLALARRTQKHVAMRTICTFAAFAYISYLPLSGGSGFGALIAGAVVSGLAFGAPFALARSMMADVIEMERLRTGENRSGLYYAFMSSAYKTGASLAVGISYFLLQVVAGFDPAPDAQNGPDEVRGLMLIFVGVPVAAYIAAAAMAWGYPITRDVQADISRQLRDRSTATAE